MVQEMSLITDGLLIAICLAATLYCRVLSQRLREFSDTKTGVGEQVAQLSVRLEETRDAVKESRVGARQAAERLAREVAQAKKIAADLNHLIESAERTRLGMDLDTSAEPAPAKQQPASETEAAAPAREPERQPEPEIEEDEDLLSEEDVDLDAVRGDPQLGFLPELDELEDDGALSAPIDPAEDHKVAS